MPTVRRSQLHVTADPKEQVEPGTKVALVARIPVFANDRFQKFVDQGYVVPGFTCTWSLEDGSALEGVAVPPPQGSVGAFDWDTETIKPGRVTVKATVTLRTERTKVEAADEETLFEELQALLDELEIEGLKFEGTCEVEFVRVPSVAQALDRGLSISLRRSAAARTNDLALWVVIRNNSDAIGFDRYAEHLDYVLCGIPPKSARSISPDSIERYQDLAARRFLPYSGTDAYRLLKVATEAFLLVNCGTAMQGGGLSDQSGTLWKRLGLKAEQGDLKGLWDAYRREVNGQGSDSFIPYLALVRRKFPDLPLKSGTFLDPDSLDDPGKAELCYGLLRDKLSAPCLMELIWNYWMESGMLSMSLNAVALRFQNAVQPDGRSPLAMLEIDPLRPLSNLMWGHIQDELSRLTLQRRVHEYSHHYGLTLEGRAVRPMRPADHRSKFLEAFHNLLYLCAVFYKEDDDTTIVADGFPVLNALKEVHLILSEGAGNQFGDLPATARQEMLIQQWLLARPEFREFLPTRTMVAFPEKWMDRVEAMKSLQGWSDASILHFRNLAIFGERLLLSARWGAWSTVEEPDAAANWARFWRAEVQGYIHAYRAAVGVDLTTEPSDARQARMRVAQPARLLAERRAASRAMPAGLARRV